MADPTYTLPDLPLLTPDLPEGFSHSREFHSYSSIDAYCSCPQAYKARYIDKHLGLAQPTVQDPNGPLELGTLIHRCLELTTQTLWTRGHRGLVGKQAALYYDQLGAAFSEQPTAGSQALVEAQEILKAWLPTEHVYAEQIRGLEWPFELVLEDAQGDVQIRGFIDRLEIAPDGTIRILDYKSSRLLFTHDELRQSLQASIYEMAVRDSPALGINADDLVEVEFVMLRHPGVRQRTHRTPEQLNLAFTTVVNLVRKIESTRTFPPQLNKYCGYCDHRYRCPLWRQMVQGDLVRTHTEPMDLQAIAEEYERMSNASKIMYAWKEELGDLMRIHLIGNDSIETRQHIYRLSNAQDTEFLDPHRIATLFAQAFKRPLAQVMGRLTTVKKAEFDLLMKAINGRLDLQAQKEFAAEMATLMEQTPAPKLQAYKNPVSSNKPAVKTGRARSKVRA